MEIAEDLAYWRIELRTPLQVFRDVYRPLKLVQLEGGACGGGCLNEPRSRDETLLRLSKLSMLAPRSSPRSGGNHGTRGVQSEDVNPISIRKRARIDATVTGIADVSSRSYVGEAQHRISGPLG